MRTNLKCFVLLALMVTTSAKAKAKAKAKATENSNDLLNFVALEGIAIAHSWLLSRSPYAYGVISGAAYPAFGIESKRDSAFWVTLGAAEAMNGYTMIMERNDVSKQEMFKRNLIGWHVVFAITVASHSFLGKNQKDLGIWSKSLSSQPTRHGGELRFEYRF
jgi:hypothetical protein